VITQIASGQRRIRLGAVYPTRDFSYIDDTVAGFIAALHANNGAVGQVINLGSNYEVSIGDTAHEIARLMGTSIEIVTEDERLRPTGSEVERLWCDPGKASALLGWGPTYAGRDGLRRGLAHTIAWFMQPNNLAAYKPDLYNL
jgi:dTDP-glucose 4,6-dehydratase